MYKAIIVDDESTIVNGLSQVLPWAKYDCEVVATAGDGESALALVNQHKPDILFTDIRMPGMDGLTLIAALRSEYPAMQITILSGHKDFDYAQRAIELGVVRYVVKPSKMAELEDALRLMVENLQGKANREDTVDGEDAPGKRGDSAGNFIVNNAVQYIEEHYAEKLTLPLVAGKVYVSQWHLSKLISRYTGRNFNDILNSVRIKHAKELLHDPSLKIWEISERVGFSDVTHFSRIFKKLEGRSANEYRNDLDAEAGAV